MENTSSTITDPADRQVISTRTFNAPRALVFKAFADPERLSQWWGPKGFTNTFEEFNFTPGGDWRFIMHGPDGKNYPNYSVFEDIQHPERIILNHISPPVFKATFELQATGEQTKLTFTMLFDTAETCSKLKHIVVPANEENFERLEIQLNKQ